MIPFSTFGERLDFIVRASAAYGLMAILFILNIASLPPPLSISVKIPFILIAIYYWSIYRPTFLPAIFVFAAGLLFDLLSGAPLGLNALIFMAAHWIIADQRKFLMAQSFFVIWLGFIMLDTTVMLVQWLVYGLIQMNFASILTIIPDIIIGGVAYPFIAFLIHLSHKILPEPKMPLMRQSSADGFTRTK